MSTGKPLAGRNPAAFTALLLVLAAGVTAGARQQKMPPGATGAKPKVVAAVPKLAPYALPADVKRRLLKLAAQGDVLVLGEIHGTREVPQVVAALLPDLAKLGYRGIALEVPGEYRRTLEAWARDPSQPVPGFFARPSVYGNANAETLAVVRAALAQKSGGRGAAWRVLCFDLTEAQLAAVRSGGGASAEDAWRKRDAVMAKNLAEQRARFCPQGKVIAVCGNLHSRLTNRYPEDSPLRPLWPSFAANLAQGSASDPMTVRSVNVVFRGGTYFNVAVRKMGAPGVEAIASPLIVEDGPGGTGHTLELHLPRSTAASFLAVPREATTSKGKRKQ